MVFSAYQAGLVHYMLFHLQSGQFPCLGLLSIMFILASPCCAIQYYSYENTILSVEGALLVIIFYVLQTLRSCTQRCIQSLTKHVGWSVFQKSGQGFLVVGSFCKLQS